MNTLYITWGILRLLVLGCRYYLGVCLEKQQLGKFHDGSHRTIFLMVGVLFLCSSFSSVCRPALGYTDIRTDTDTNIYRDIDKTTGKVEKQILIHFFPFYPSDGFESLESLESSTSFKAAASIQQDYDSKWSDFAKLVHIVPLSEDHLKDEKTKNLIKKWADKNKASTVLTLAEDPIVREEVVPIGTPLIHVSLYDPDGREWRSTSADPRGRTWKHEVFRLMEDYFIQNYQIDEFQDWISWMDNMKKISPVLLFERYFDLGKDRLKRGNQRRDYREPPICAVPPLLSNQDSDLIKTAISAFEHAIEEKRNEAEAYNYLGTAHYRKRDYENALSNLKIAVNLDDSEPVYKHNLAMAHLKLGNIQEAKVTLEICLPGDERAKEIWKHIDGPSPFVPPLLAAVSTLSGTGVFVYRLRYKSASDELAKAEEISPSEEIKELTTTDFEKQMDHWGNYKRYKRRSRMLDITSANLITNSIPFWLDGLDIRSPGKGKIMLLYGAKTLAFSVTALVWYRKGEDAKEDGEAETELDMRQYHFGRHQEANETMKMLLVNAGIDLLTWFGLLRYYEPENEVSISGDARLPHSFLPYSFAGLPIGLSIRSNGNGRRLALSVRGVF